jgi:hypothetical protein
MSYTSVEGRTVMAELAHLTRSQERFLMGDARPADRPNVARTLAAMAVMERRLLAMASPAQRAIGWGSWVWMRFEPQPGWVSVPDRAVTVYGYIFTQSELERREREAMAKLMGMGHQPVQNPADTVAACHESHRLGWRYGTWYSEIEPGGEPGENHIAMLHRLSRVQFEAARAAGWPQEPPRA